MLKNKFDDFGRLLHEGWKLKKSLGKVITNQKIDEFNYSMAEIYRRKNIGRRESNMLLYIPRDKIKNFKKKLVSLRSYHLIFLKRVQKFY